ncbi:hypothetical protein [Nocardioides sp.]|uniref:hypothetical protein n=1 Tax=Nocardioides sp. TaxID=35761 RepID=UPI001A32859A|nr:hypothetical protein [Nocardioides sp.]MBJ7358531.1 hypothetical protein [Nocardioides sp.]
MRTLVTVPLVAALLVMSTAGPAAAADTEITSGPENGAVLLPGPVTYTFTANEGGATYECSVDDAPFGACPAATSATYDLPPGGHVFRVRSVVLGQTDASPAERVWTIRNVPCEQAGAAYAAARSDFFTHKTKKGYTKEKRQRAKDAGKAAKVERLTKKIKRLNQKIKRARAAMAAALAQEQAVC